MRERIRGEVHQVVADLSDFVQVRKEELVIELPLQKRPTLWVLEKEDVVTEGEIGGSVHL
jgi:hypothetical protein